jgi:hypothetical protein
VPDALLLSLSVSSLADALPPLVSSVANTLLPRSLASSLADAIAANVALASSLVDALLPMPLILTIYF